MPPDKERRPTGGLGAEETTTTRSTTTIPPKGVGVADLTRHALTLAGHAETAVRPEAKVATAAVAQVYATLALAATLSRMDLRDELDKGFGL